MIPQGFGFVKPFLRILFHCGEKGGTNASSPDWGVETAPESEVVSEPVILVYFSKRDFNKFRKNSSVFYKKPVHSCAFFPMSGKPSMSCAILSRKRRWI